MKSNNNTQLIQLAGMPDTTLRLAYKNEEVINETANTGVAEIEKAVPKAKLFVKEPLPLYNDYRIKYRDHDPL